MRHQSLLCKHGTIILRIHKISLSAYEISKSLLNHMSEWLTQILKVRVIVVTIPKMVPHSVQTWHVASYLPTPHFPLLELYALIRTTIIGPIIVRRNGPLCFQAHLWPKVKVLILIDSFCTHNFLTTLYGLTQIFVS